MGKKITSFRLEPEVQKELKHLSVDYSKPMGDIIEGLVKFSKSAKYIKDEEFRKRFNSLLKISLKNTGKRAEWEGEIPDDE